MSDKKQLSICILLFNKASIRLLLLISLCLFIFQPVDFFDGFVKHHDCPLCQMLNGQAPVPGFDAWMIVALFVLSVQKITPDWSLLRYNFSYNPKNLSRAPPII